MAAIKELSQISEKFITVTPQRAAQYEAGVKAPKRDWATATAASETNFEAGITAALRAKSFGKGVKKAGSGKYVKGVLEKGVVRWPVGVGLAQEAFEAGYAPYHAVIARTTLPARYPRRDPRNLDRVKAIDMALGAEKVAKG